MNKTQTNIKEATVTPIVTATVAAAIKETK